MATTRKQTIAVGVFENPAQAREAIRELKGMGYTDEQIGVASRHEEAVPEGVEKHEEGNHAGSGAAVGAATGAGVGGLWGLAILGGVLPAVGPAIAGGALASILTSAAAGAAAGGLAGALLGLGVPKEEADYYEEEFHRGRTVVTVKAGDRRDDVRTVLRRHGAYDIDTRHEHAAATGRQGRVREDEGRMEVREEELHARKQPTRAGEVNVRKETVAERQKVEVPVEREEVVVERRPTDRRTAGGPVGESEEVRIPVKEEHARVDKETVSKGEVDVKKRTTRDVEQVEDTVKKERVKVDRKGNAPVKDRTTR